jgi:hypothetical protein
MCLQLRAALVVEMSRTQTALNQLNQLTHHQTESEARYGQDLADKDSVIGVLQQELEVLKNECAKAVTTQEKVLPQNMEL